MNMPYAKTLREIARRRGLCLYLLLFVTAIFFAGSNYANAEPVAVLGGGGSFERGALPRTGNWQGLFCNGYGCELRPVAPSVVPAVQENAGGEFEETDELSVDEGETPLALIQGLPFATGVVPTWYAHVVAADSAESAQSRSLRKLGRWEMPWGFEPLTLSWVKLPQQGGFRYHLGNPSRKQFLFRTELEGHYGGSTSPVIHWAGDLDGDGRTDMLLSLPDDECGFDVRLYLSSKARQGEWVGKGARFAGRTPACGC